MNISKRKTETETAIKLLGFSSNEIQCEKNHWTKINENTYWNAFNGSLAIFQDGKMLVDVPSVIVDMLSVQHKLYKS